MISKAERSRELFARALDLMPVKSIAILPFQPLTGGDGDEALQLGMADALITKLSNIKQI